MEHQCDTCVFAVYGHYEEYGTVIDDCQLMDAMTHSDIELVNVDRCPRYEKYNGDVEDIPMNYILFAEWYATEKARGGIC